MRLPLALALVALTVLGGCAAIRDSRVNPFNWFGTSQRAERQALTNAVRADARPLVAEVVSMVVEPYPGGAIVRATGLPPSQGWWDAELVPRPLDENGVLVFDFRVFPPLDGQPAGQPRTRTVTVGANVTTFRLQSVTEIVVQGSGNARSSRR